MKASEWLNIIMLVVVLFLCFVLESTNLKSDDRFWAASDSLHVNGERYLKAESLVHLDSCFYYNGKMDAYFEVENKELKTK